LRGQRGAFLTRQSAEKRRHGKGGGVRITRVSLRQRFDEMRDLACVKAPRRRACGG
jgi:stalled ribosome alternative rescue factor ArfA